jgi:putative hemolysin
MSSPIKIDNSWKNFPISKSAWMAKAASIGHQYWEDGFLSTGIVFSDIDNIKLRPSEEDPMVARARIVVQAPEIFNGNASAATIAIYNGQLARYQLFMTAQQEIKNFILSSLPVSYFEKIKHPITQLHTHLSIVAILNDMEREYGARVDDLIECWKLDLIKPFTAYSDFTTEIGAFTLASNQLMLLGDLQSDHSLRSQLKKNCRGVPQIMATITAYEAKTLPTDRTLALLISDIHVFGQAHATITASGFASNIIVSDVPTISDLLAVIASLTASSVTKPLHPLSVPVQSKLKKNMQSNYNSNYCFEHGYGLTHSGHECKKMIDATGGLREGYTIQMVLCKQPGVTLVDGNGVARVSRAKAN